MPSDRQRQEIIRARLNRVVNDAQPTQGEYSGRDPETGLSLITTANGSILPAYLEGSAQPFIGESMLFALTSDLAYAVGRDAIETEPIISEVIEPVYATAVLSLETDDPFTAANLYLGGDRDRIFLKEVSMPVTGGTVDAHDIVVGPPHNNDSSEIALGTPLPVTDSGTLSIDIAGGTGTLDFVNNQALGSYTVTGTLSHTLDFDLDFDVTQIGTYQEVEPGTYRVVGFTNTAYSVSSTQRTYVDVSLSLFFNKSGGGGENILGIAGETSMNAGLASFDITRTIPDEPGPWTFRFRMDVQYDNAIDLTFSATGTWAATLIPLSRYYLVATRQEHYIFVMLLNSASYFTVDSDSSIVETTFTSDPITTNANDWKDSLATFANPIPADPDACQQDNRDEQHVNLLNGIRYTDPIDDPFEGGATMRDRLEDGESLQNVSVTTEPFTSGASCVIGAASAIVVREIKAITPSPVPVTLDVEVLATSTYEL